MSLWQPDLEAKFGRSQKSIGRQSLWAYNGGLVMYHRQGSRSGHDLNSNEKNQRRSCPASRRCSRTLSCAAASKSTYFHEVMMVGNLPESYKVPWRSTALLQETTSGPVSSDVSGGWLTGQPPNPSLEYLRRLHTWHVKANRSSQGLSVIGSFMKGCSIGLSDA